MSTRMTPTDAANIIRHLTDLVATEPSEDAKGVVERVTNHLKEYIATETAGATDQGGPAYPVPEAGLPTEPGMTLRDHFAGLALQAFLTGHISHYGHESHWPYPDMAKCCLEVADAMLEARGK